MTAALDMRFGRRGGHLMPWHRQGPAFDIGERVMLDDHQVDVLEQRARHRYLIRFANGAELTVHETHLTAVL